MGSTTLYIVNSPADARHYLECGASDRGVVCTTHSAAKELFDSRGVDCMELSRHITTAHVLQAHAQSFPGEALYKEKQRLLEHLQPAGRTFLRTLGVDPEFDPFQAMFRYRLTLGLFASSLTRQALEDRKSTRLNSSHYS